MRKLHHNCKRAKRALRREGFPMVEQNHLASTEWVDIVSEENEVIAQASREQMRA
ncbi:NUDIX hydrolase YfcD, partial [Enterobacter hormaechei]